MNTINPQPRPGKLVRSTVRISRDAQQVDLPVWVASGRQPGPTGLLSAGIHGDEVHAIRLGHRFVQEFNLGQLTGRTTSALAEDDRRFIAVLKEVLVHA